MLLVSYRPDGEQASVPRLFHGNVIDALHNGLLIRFGLHCAGICKLVRVNDLSALKNTAVYKIGVPSGVRQVILESNVVLTHG